VKRPTWLCALKRGERKLLLTSCCGAGSEDLKQENWQTPGIADESFPNNDSFHLLSQATRNAESEGVDIRRHDDTLEIISVFVSDERLLVWEVRALRSVSPIVIGLITNCTSTPKCGMQFVVTKLVPTSAASSNYSDPTEGCVMLRIARNLKRWENCFRPTGDN
jgi:hypothetical protein